MDRLLIRSFVRPGEHCHFARNLIRRSGGFDPHRHDFLELFWVTEGEGVEWLAGEQRRLRPGSVALVAADDAHGFASDDPRGVRLANLAFPLRVWEELRDRVLVGRPDPFANAAPRRFESGPTVARVLDAYADELDAGARDRFACERFLLNAVRVLRDCAPATAPAPAWLAEALARIAADPRRLRDGPHALVALAGRSHEHVAREARRAYGKTPTDLVNDARIAWAARRLAESDDAILDLCLACGLSNLGHFYRLFHARMGDAPSRWRARQRAIVQPG